MDNTKNTNTKNTAGPAAAARKHYIDNIRWSVVILVMIYHVCYIYNGLGILGAVPGADNIPAFDTLACIIYPWFMVLLFVVAGISSRYSLQKRTIKQFLGERAKKLLIPSTLGLFVLHWITGYLNIKMGGGLSFIPSFLVYPISVLSGSGPLWFIQTLFLFSCAAALLKKFDKNDKIWSIFTNTHMIFILLCFILIWGSAQILNMPVITVYRFGIYFISFLIGYYIFSHEEVQSRIEKIHIPMAIAAVLSAFLYACLYYGADYTAPSCLQSIYTNLYLWIVVIAVFGCAGRYFNFRTKITSYLSQNSFGLYILHYPVLIITCYIMQYYTSLPAVCKYTAALAAELIFTFALNEIIKRIPVISFLILGKSHKQSSRRKFL